MYYETHVSILAKSLIISFHYNIESVNFFYSNPLYIYVYICVYVYIKNFVRVVGVGICVISVASAWAKTASFWRWLFNV
jgi:hypothetical protein